MSLRLRACARDATAQWLTSKTTPPRRVPSGRRASPPLPGAASAAHPRARCARHQSTKNLPSSSRTFFREIPIASVGDDALVTRATLTMPTNPYNALRAITQDLDIEHVKPTRRAAAPAAAAAHSSDHSEDTGIEGTDAPENATARPASRGKAAPRKGGPVPDAKAASSECDEDSAAATPKHAKAAKAAAQGKKKETPAGKTEDVAVRQRPTNNQLLCVSRDGARALERRDAPRPTRPTYRVLCRRFPRPRGLARVCASRASPRIPADDHLPLAFFALPRDHASSRLPIADRAGTRLGSTGSTTPTRSRRERTRCFPARPRRAPRSRPPFSRYVPTRERREVFLFSVLFADCASARCRVCLLDSQKSRRVPERDRRARRARGRGHERSIAVDRGRSVAHASLRSTRSASPRRTRARRAAARRRSRRPRPARFDASRGNNTRLARERRRGATPRRKKKHKHL